MCSGHRILQVYGGALSFYIGTYSFAFAGSGYSSSSVASSIFRSINVSITDSLVSYSRAESNNSKTIHYCNASKYSAAPCRCACFETTIVLTIFCVAGGFSNGANVRSSSTLVQAFFCKCLKRFSLGLWRCHVGFHWSVFLELDVILFFNVQQC